MSEADSDKPTRGSDSDDRFSLLAQLKERRVFRSAAAYAVVAWGVTEILEGVIAGLGWPDWIATLAVILFVLGFPVAMFLAWVYDWTPDGIHRTASSGAMGWLPAIGAAIFLLIGTAGLFWLINPSGVARAETRGIAVLPCRHRGDPAFAFRGDGFAEVINARLSYSTQLFVPDFVSVRRISALNLGTAGLAERLHVAWLIECRITDSDGGLVIETSMVDIETDQSSALARSNAGSLELLDALNNIETALFNRLDLVQMLERRRTLDSHLTSSLGAFDEYLAGLQAMHAGTAAGYEQARKHFRQAQRAGDFPLSRLAEAEAMLTLLELEPSALKSTRHSMLKAVDLILDQVGLKDPAPAELYAARLRLANLVDRMGVLPVASDEQRREWLNSATEIRPSFAAPYSHYADYLEQRGDGDEAAEFRARARQLAPE